MIARAPATVFMCLTWRPEPIQSATIEASHWWFVCPAPPVWELRVWRQFHATLGFRKSAGILTAPMLRVPFGLSILVKAEADAKE
jgi:hypothetical protein